MKSVFIILNFSILAIFATAKLTEREKAFENGVRAAFTDPGNLGNFSVGPGNGVLRVNQITNNMRVTGLGKAQIKKVKADFEAGIVILSYEAPRLTAYVDYELDGSCLLIPIWGKGKGVVVMNDVRVTANATVETLDGKVKIRAMKVTYDISGGSFSLSSLFGESSYGILTPLYVKIFNTNAKYIFNEILPSYIPPSEAKLSKLWGILLEKI